jgi:sodium/hydrogen antiporter
VEGVPAEKHLPDRLRYALAFESAANDGAAYPIVFLPFLFLTLSAGKATSEWLLDTILWDVVGAAVIGMAFGYVSARLLLAAEKRDLITDDWRLVYTAAMSIAGLGAGHLLGISEFVLVFAAVVTGAQLVSSKERKDEEHGQEAANRFLSVPIFGLLGTAIPWDGWRELGWKGLLLAVAIILLRRVPAMLLICPLVPLLRRRADTLFMGWFGPIGVATIYYGTQMEQKLGTPFIWNVVSLVICLSIVTHGLTAVPFTRLYGRLTGQTAQNAKREEEQQREAKRAEQEDCKKRLEEASPADGPKAVPGTR